MLFNSFVFLLFFLVTSCCWWLTKPAWRWIVLLVASCVFYAFAVPAYLLVLFAIILIDFSAAIAIERSGVQGKKVFLCLSIAANLGILFLFKYHDFLVRIWNSRTAADLPLWHWLLPIGLSFHTFQAMAYSIDVYQGRQKAEKHLGIYALFVLFYPQLVAGPIERAGHLIPQLKKPAPASAADWGTGLKWMLWGYFLKVVLADRLGIYVDYVFLQIESHGRLALAIAAFFYSFQIYGDFAGYSLIALGTARCMGISLTPNFRRPYLSSSLRTFWQRWNITLSGWFRDYVYIPLGGNRVNRLKFFFNVFVVFILSGFWHGANTTFLLWGAIHGALWIFSYLVGKTGRLTLLRKWIGIPLTFFLVTIAWIFFRAPDIHSAFLYLGRLFDPATRPTAGGEFDERVLLLTGFLAIGFTVVAEIAEAFFPRWRPPVWNRQPWFRLAACIALVIVILLFGVFDGSQFIYFQF